jgi:tetratricopeptide (TPR) repeat protein
MQAISDALTKLHEDLSWFARAQEVELLVIRTTGDLRKTVVELLPMLEFHNDNRSPWVLFEDAHLAEDRGWQVRANRLLKDWERRREAFMKERSIDMPPAVFHTDPPPSGRASLRPPAPYRPFEATLAAVLRALREPYDGSLVAIFAPTILDDVESFGAELWELMIADALRPARWILVIDSSQQAPSIVQRMGQYAIVCDCIPNPDQQSKDFAALIAAPSIGRAGPRTAVRPKRIDDPPPIPPEIREKVLREAGVDPQYLEKAPELGKLLLGAALAMKEGRGKEAIEMQRRARDLCVQLSLREPQVLCQVALASYLSGLGLREQAIAELRSAIEQAKTYQLGLQEAQARLALGLIYALEKRFVDAAREYAECARRAEAVNVPLIAIEAWRLAGQIAIAVGSEAQAAACFQEAIRIASGSTVDVVQISSAPEAARALALRCQEKGLRAQAESLYTQADAMERGEIGVPKEKEARVETAEV